MIENAELPATLEKDLEKLEQENLSWGMRMAVTYRSEKKKILRNQLFMAKMMQYVVSHAIQAVADNVYRELVMREVDGEVELDK